MAGACTATVTGSPITFCELEDECIEAGDLLTAAMLQRRIAGKFRGWNRLTTVATAGDLFLPHSSELGLGVDDTVSPRVLAKMIYPGASAASFAAASRDLANLVNLSISDERVRRASGRLASDRAYH